jgi:branched-chain amino acid transport system substrate-binding protein
VIGSIMGSQYFYEQPTYFPQGSSGDMFFAAYAASIAQQAKSEGKRKIGIMACAEVADCETGADLTERYAKEFGLEVVYRAAASIVAPDYTAQCLNARNAGVQVLLPIFTPDGASRIAASCARQSYRPSYGLTTQTFGPLQITDPNMQDSIIFSPVFTWVADPPTPAVAEFNAAMARYLPGTPIKGVHAVGWTSAKLFERAAAHLSEPPTNESLLTGLYTIANDDLGGLTQPLTFTRDKPAAQVACWYTTLIRNGKLVPVDGGRRSCR